MTKQIIFAISFLATLGVFFYTINRIVRFFRLTRPAFPVKDFRKRITVMLSVAFGQTKIFRKPVIGFFHALVFWGFCVIIFGSLEMVIDGLTGTDRVLKSLGPVYNIIIASGDIFALLVAISIILLLMVSLLSMNTGYIEYKTITRESSVGLFPVSSVIAGFINNGQAASYRAMYEASWWTHILLIFLFANLLPYSKHFHVFMSIPNVFLSRLDPLGKLTNMDNITREVRLMLDPNKAFAASASDAPPERFGVKDVEDASWKNYFDSLACTQCGRCTAVCPANITGKKLSPRKVIMDLRTRMNEK